MSLTSARPHDREESHNLEPRRIVRLGGGARLNQSPDHHFLPDLSHISSLALWEKDPGTLASGPLVLACLWLPWPSLVAFQLVTLNLAVPFIWVLYPVKAVSVS